MSPPDVAKILLKSAKDDRLDFRLEVAELQLPQPKPCVKFAGSGAETGPRAS